MIRPTTSLQAAADAVLIALFCAFLALPLLDSGLGLDPALPLNENRTLAKLPGAPANNRELAAFPARFEAFATMCVMPVWLSDRSGARLLRNTARVSTRGRRVR